jgi:diaminopimelate epimerase
MRPRLFKVEGAGNDFLLGIGGWADRLARDPELVRRFCDRRHGIGADGAMALTAEGTDRVRLIHRNADGGEANFCANGTRCAARAAVELLGCEARLVVETAWKPIPAQIDGRLVTLEIPALDEVPCHPAIAASDSMKDLQFVKVGVPHLVVSAADIAGLDLPVVGPPLRSHEALGPDGANVSFYEIDPDGAVRLRTWECGVEGETLSCGSGMVAVALVVMAARDLRRLVLIPASGDRLTVEALGRPPSCPIRLTGPVHFIAEIEPSEDFLRTL